MPVDCISLVQFLSRHLLAHQNKGNIGAKGRTFVVLHQARMIMENRQLLYFTEICGARKLYQSRCRTAYRPTFIGTAGPQSRGGAWHCHVACRLIGQGQNRFFRLSHVLQNSRRMFKQDCTRFSRFNAPRMSDEKCWSPTFPYKSSLTGQSATELAVGLYEGDRKAVDAANRICPFALRSCLRYSQAECRCAGCCGQSGFLAQNQFGDDRRSDWLGQRTNQKRRKDPACKRAMAARFRWPFQVRSCHRR